MKRMPLWRELCYSGGSFSSGLIGTVVSSLLMFYYIDTLHFNEAAIGIAMALYAVWNAINDPLLGFISDRTKTRMGRRIPYLLFGTLPMMLAFYLIWSPPLHLLTTEGMRNLYFFLSISIYDTFFTMVALNWTAVVPEMYTLEKDRTRLYGLSQAFGVIGAFAGTLAAEPLFKAYGWPVMGAILAIIGAVTMFLSLFGMKENPENVKVEPLGFFESFKQTFKSKSFVICVISILFIETAKVLTLAMLPFFSRYVIKVDFAYTILMGVILFSAVLFTPLIIWVTDKKGAKVAYVSSLVVFGLGLLCFFFATTLIPAIIVGIFVGYGVTGVLVVPSVFYSQIIDEDYVRTGRRREGAYFGMNAFIMRFSVAIQSILMTQVMRWTGYDSIAAVQSESALTGIKLLMSAAPMLMCVLALVAILFYPLHGQRLRQVQLDVQRMTTASEGNSVPEG